MGPTVTQPSPSPAMLHRAGSGETVNLMWTTLLRRLRQAAAGPDPVFRLVLPQRPPALSEAAASHSARVPCGGSAWLIR